MDPNGGFSRNIGRPSFMHNISYEKHGKREKIKQVNFNKIIWFYLFVFYLFLTCI